MESALPTSAHGSFAPTRWTLVLRARGETPEARAALSDLCAACCQPVFRFLRREGHTEDAARELTQEFFARVLAVTRSCPTWAMTSGRLTEKKLPRTPRMGTDTTLVRPGDRVGRPETRPLSAVRQPLLQATDCQQLSSGWPCRV